MIDSDINHNHSAEYATAVGTAAHMSLHSSYNEKERRYLTPSLKPGKPEWFFVRPGSEPTGPFPATGEAYMLVPDPSSTPFFKLVHFRELRSNPAFFEAELKVRRPKKAPILRADSHGCVRLL